MMIYFHCSDLHVTPRQRDRNTRSTCCFLHGRLGFGEVYPLLLLIQCNEMKIICSMLKMVMLVSKERKSTRFFHSFFDFHSDKTTPSMDGNGNRHRQSRVAAMSTMLSKSKNSEGIWGQTGGKMSDIGSNRIYRYFPKC